MKYRVVDQELPNQLANIRKNRKYISASCAAVILSAALLQVKAATCKRAALPCFRIYLMDHQQKVYTEESKKDKRSIETKFLVFLGFRADFPIRPCFLPSAEHVSESGFPPTAISNVHQ